MEESAIAAVTLIIEYFVLDLFLQKQLWDPCLCELAMKFLFVWVKNVSAHFKRHESEGQHSVQIVSVGAGVLGMQKNYWMHLSYLVMDEGQIGDAEVRSKGSQHVQITNPIQTSIGQHRKIFRRLIVNNENNVQIMVIWRSGLSPRKLMTPSTCFVSL